ncbi:sigma-70 family RNA polymerase sigma factor [Lentibacillus halophilus]
MKLMKEYENDIYRTAYVYTKNEADALDIVQETVFQSYSKVNNLRNPQYFKTWLIKITINSAIDLVRKKKNITHLKPEYTDNLGEDDGNITLSITLRGVIENLNEQEKSIVLLKYYYGYTFKEIADILRVPTSTAKSVLYRSLQKMREDMKEDDVCER